jgi:hypothetical protein
VALGGLLGFTLSMTGFSDYDELHKMFLFQDLRLLFCFMGGMVMCVIGFRTACRRSSHAGKPIHPGTIPGGLIFGVGWALTGACPTLPLVQLGEGKLIAFVPLVGVVAGMTLYRTVHARFFRWDRGSCGI